MVADKVDIENLAFLGYLKQHASSGADIITAKGKTFLDVVLSGQLPSIKQPYHQQAVVRRIKLARLLITAYQAKVNIFTTHPEDLSECPSLFSSSITRERGFNPWGSTRTAAMLHLPDLIAALHYVEPNIGNIAFVDEINVLVNQSSHIKEAEKAFIFAGSSYSEILTELDAEKNDIVSKKIRYGDAFRISTFPIYILPCNDTGAKQLRLMSVPGYRQWFTRATLQSEYEPPPADAPDWDAIFRGAPFIMAADMELRRIDRAIAEAKRRGYPSVSMAALEPQAKEVLYPRYADAAKVFVWTPEIEEALFGGLLRLRSAETVPFRNAKGEYVNAPLIQADRKSGRPAGKEAR